METPQETTEFWHSGLQRWLPPWERRHLRAWAGARLGAASVLAVCGVLTLAFGGSEGKTYGFAALFLGLAALIGAAGYWELTLARSAARRP
jgi:hypothetical protein